MGRKSHETPNSNTVRRARAARSIASAALQGQLPGGQEIVDSALDDEAEILEQNPGAAGKYLHSSQWPDPNIVVEMTDE